MLHIAEERLHAYVDRDRSDMTPDEAAAVEAHLAVCELCDAAVREETLVRERANLILAHSGPQRVVVPDFEAIRARAGAEEAAPAAATVTDIRTHAPMRRSYVALAWAASLVAALGLGWLTRDVFRERDQVAIEMVTSDAEREEALTFGAAADSPAAGDASAIAALPPNAGMSPIEPAAPSRLEAAGGSAEAGKQTPNTTGSVATRADRSLPADSRGAADAPQAGAAAGGSDSRAAPTVRALAFDSTIERDAGPVSGDADRASRDPRPQAARAEAAPTVAADLDASRDPAAIASQNAPAPPTPSAAPAAPTAAAPQAASARLAWVEMSRADAESIFGTALLTIPDLPVQRIAVLGSGPSAMVRVWQTTADGREVILSQARQSAGQIGVTGAEAARRIGEMMVMAEGDLAPERLLELLGRVR